MVLSTPHYTLLADLNRYSCLDNQYIHRQYFSHVTLRRCQQITAELAAKGLTFLAKPLATFIPTKRNVPCTKRVPAISFLSRTGADALFAHTGEEPFRVLRSSPQPHTLLHRLEHVKFRLAFDRSLSDLGMDTPEWILESDTRDDLTEKLPPNQRSMLYHRFEAQPRNFSCRPDAACRCTIDGTRYFIHWEHDRSTEGVPQLTRKARGLNALILQLAFRRYWPDVNPQDKLRIFWTVPSVARVRTLLSTLKSHDQVLARSRFYIRPIDAEVGDDGVDTRQLITDKVLHMPDGSIVSVL